MGAELREPAAPSPLPVVTYWPEEFGAFPGRQYELTTALAHRRRVIALGRRRDPSWRSPVVEERRHGCTTVATVLVTNPVAALGRVAPDAAQRWLGATVRRYLRAGGATPFVLWSSVVDLPFTQGLRAALEVFDVIDPPLTEPAVAGYDLALRGAVARGARFTATAAELVERVESFGGSAVLVPNGCRSAPVPRERDSSAPFTAGYLGTIDTRVDLGLLESVVTSAPDVHFVIGGRWNHGTETVRARLARRPNVVITGPVPYERSDDFLDGLDVGLIPFVPGPVGDAINPVKLYEYLAHGSEVLATPIREVRTCPLARCAATATEWVQVLRELRGAPRRRAALAEAVRPATWEARAEQVDRLLREWAVTAGLERATGPEAT